MNTNQSRTEFEEWASPLPVSFYRNQSDDSYEDEKTKLAWEAWQESRKSMVPTEVADRLRNALMSVRPYSRNVAEIVDAALDATKP